MEELAQRKCAPCDAGTPPMNAKEIELLVGQVGEWKVVDNHHLARDFKFRNFREALDFVNRIGAVAEAEGHHPDIMLSWGKVSVTLLTHKIHGLSENDFILAAKIDALLAPVR
ncbi:MAG: 4a-hydroxytetrahydrobiopterin dehydratase [Spirochaetes bacterium]|nr:MAG: 4a-hydroxytetrahydrobiopterin dehydratase [Spirochaetota bacterium]